jgi:hypothetical protein
MKKRLSMPQILDVVVLCGVASTWEGLAGVTVVTAFPHFGQKSVFGLSAVPHSLQKLELANFHTAMF